MQDNGILPGNLANNKKSSPNQIVPTSINRSKTSRLSDWEFKGATLVRQLENGTVAQTGDEGLLYVTVAHKVTGEERRGTVCDDGFSRQTAVLFCQSMGYNVLNRVNWGSDRTDKYVPG